jgi:NADH-quinone oxidoreductase subunit F
MSENLSNLSARKGLTTNLFEKTVKAKGDPISLKALSKEFKVGEANIYSASTSYDFIQGNNAAKKAYLCNGSSCLCANTQAKVKQALEKHISSEQIGHVTCLGRCHENAAFQIDGANYSGNAFESIQSILESQSVNQQDQYNVVCLMEEPILTEGIKNIPVYYQLFADLISQSDKQTILQSVINSGLRGRGGAGFPTGIKWKSCAEELGPEKYIVCNADEGDPGAFSDRYLMEQRPHAVLFGMLVAGYLAGAEWGILYIRDEYPESVNKVQQAIEEFEALKILPESVNFQFKIVRGAGAYICGEETALLRSIEGQKPMVSVRPPFPTVKGLFGKPTVLNNVETFAAIHWILEHSAEAYAALNNHQPATGSQHNRLLSTGSKLISLDSGFNRPGIYEVAMGEKLSKVVEQAGGFSSKLKALHIGGPLGGLVPISKVDDLTIDFESFSEHGFLLGHASIIGVPDSFSIPEYVEHLFEFTAAESCGKCFPCRLGATRGKEMFRDARNQSNPLNRELLDDLLETMEQGSLCALGGGVPLPVKNALQYFSDEFQPLFDNQILVKEVH